MSIIENLQQLSITSLEILSCLWPSMIQNVWTLILRNVHVFFLHIQNLAVLSLLLLSPFFHTAH